MTPETGRKYHLFHALALALLAGGYVCPGVAAALAEYAPARDELAALSLEELMSVEVTLASRKEEKLFETAAAVWVITQEDLRRSGVTSIAEALRMVPGMQVGRIDASKWAISTRGFADRFAQKLLVLIDGRSVYNPLFAGVYWEVQDLLLEDVAQIEVIRGPGATLWGPTPSTGSSTSSRAARGIRRGAWSRWRPGRRNGVRSAHATGAVWARAGTTGSMPRGLPAMASWTQPGSRKATTGGWRTAGSAATGGLARRVR